MKPARSTRTSRWPVVAAVALVLGLASACSLPGADPESDGAAAGGGTVVPAAALDDADSSGTRAVAVLAGGCFWGVEGVFEHVDGVLDAVSGYAGGAAATATYEDVTSGATGHAEAVQVTFDPRVISYAEILRIYFSVAHDPTELNRQGPDVGTQYRSTIFVEDADQDRVARAYLEQLEQAEVFEAPIATTIESGEPFYPAEGYHQDFMEKNPGHPYIVRNDAPKIVALEEQFPEVFRGAAG